MVEIMLPRERKLKEAAKLKQQAKAAESWEAKLAAKKEQSAKYKATGEAARGVSVGPMKRKLEPGPAVGADTLAWSDELSELFCLELARNTAEWPQTVRPSFSCEWSKSWFLARPGRGFQSIASTTTAASSKRKVHEDFIASMKKAAVGDAPPKVRAAKAVKPEPVAAAPVIKKSVAPKATAKCSARGRGRGRDKDVARPAAAKKARGRGK